MFLKKKRTVHNGTIGLKETIQG